jgi:hypothetical protein
VNRRKDIDDFLESDVELFLTHPGMGAHLSTARQLLDYRAQEGFNDDDDD